MPVPSTIVAVVFFVGCLAGCLIPVGRMLPKIAAGQPAIDVAAQQIAEYDQKVVAFAHKAERMLLCAPTGQLGKASKETEEAFDAADDDKSGLLITQEVLTALEKYQVKGATLTDVTSMVEGGDADADGKLYAYNRTGDTCVPKLTCSHSHASPILPQVC